MTLLTTPTPQVGPPTAARAAAPLIGLCLLSATAFAFLFLDGETGLRVSLFVGIVTVVLVASAPRLRRQQLVLLGLLLLTGCVWVVRSSMWVLFPCAVTLALLVLGFQLAASRSLFDLRWSEIRRWVTHVVGRKVPSTPRWLVRGAEAALPTVGVERSRAGLRALAIAVPIVAVLMLLLATADPLFAAAVVPDVSGLSMRIWSFLFVVGVLMIGVLLHVTSSDAVVSRRPAAARLGHVESLTVLGGVSIIFIGFVAVQVSAAAGLGKETLASRGVTVAEYARSGYFQLLAVVLLTSVVLVTLDALRGGRRRTTFAERALGALIVALTLVIEVVALQRLLLYIDTFGLTMLRVACIAAAVWMSALLLLIAGSILGVQPDRSWLPAAVGAAFVATALTFAAVNPEAFVVRYNLNQPTESPVDLAYLASLSDDAVPQLVDSLDELPVTEASNLTRQLCNRSTGSPGWAGWSLSSAKAADQLAAICPAAAP